MTSENLKLWESVEKTDPNHTKKVNQRGGFTAIDAHYQVKQATEAFGAVGVGWGYHCDYQFPDKTVICLLTFWHGNRENTFGPIAGCAKFTDGRLDPEAPKKAMTDALTKALSHLGFNADVFLGKFDDNKYVNRMKEEFAPEPPKPADVIQKAAEFEAMSKLTAYWKTLTKELQGREDVKAAFSAKKAELTAE